MGVAFTRKTTKTEPNEDFRRVADGVLHIKKLQKESKQRGTNRETTGREPNSVLSTDENVASYHQSSHAEMNDSVRMGDEMGTDRVGGETESRQIPHGDTRGVVVKDTSSAWEALKRGESCDSELPSTEVGVVHQARDVLNTLGEHGGEIGITEEGRSDSNKVNSDFEEEKRIVPYELPSDWDTQVSSESTCAICSIATTDVYPCRICQRVYHQDCLQRKGRLNRSTDLGVLQRANCNIGWSCFECENLAQLLHQDDMDEIMDAFEHCDRNDDGLISLEEYLTFQRKAIEQRDGEKMTATQVREEELKFSSIDRERRGFISWWEFLSHEALRRLATQLRTKLYSLLTPREIDRAHQTFVALDTDESGNITKYEARRAYEHWYSSFTSPPRNETERKQQLLSLSTHIDTNTAILMDADTDHSGNISWEEFILEQALFIIAARPNQGQVHINPGPQFTDTQMTEQT